MESLSKIWSLIAKIRIRNWKIVILCVIGATTFKLFNALNKNYTTTIHYPVAFVYNTTGTVVMERLPEDILINVSGGGWNLFRKTLAFNVPPLQIQLEKPTEIGKIAGATLVPVITDQIKNFQLNYVVTDSLNINIEEKVAKTVQLIIDSTQIQLEENYFLVSPVRISPDTATIYGPKSIMDTIKSSFYLSTPSDPADRSFNNQLSVQMLYPSLMEVMPKAAQVSFEVSEFEPRTYNVPIRFKNFPNDSAIHVKQTTILVSAMINKDEAVNEDSIRNHFEVVADYNLMHGSDSTIRPILTKIPESVRQVALDSTASLKVNYAQ